MTMLNEIMVGRKYIIGESIVVTCIRADIDYPNPFEECLFISATGNHFDMSYSRALEKLKEVSE